MFSETPPFLNSVFSETVCFLKPWTQQGI